MLNNNFQLTKLQLTALVSLRIAIGWHFLYEGLTKVLNPGWSSIGYLLDSKGLFAPIFHSIARNASLLSVADFMNEWGLVLIGAGLILGCLTRVAAYSGMLLLALYYLSHPPFPGITYALPNEGNYFIIDKVFIEFLAVWVVALIPTGKEIGLDRLICRK